MILGGETMDSGQILIVDDDPKVRKLLRRCLEAEGFQIAEAEDEPSALSLMKGQPFSLMTLDINLGEGDGFDIVKKVRQSSQMPIVMVTGKDDVIDRVVGLELGADDYITKPFHVREVVARVRSVLRRTQAAALEGTAETGGVTGPDTDELISFDGMEANFSRLELRDRNGKLGELTSGDFKLLGVFLKNSHRVLSRDRLMDLIDGPEWTPLDRTIDNQVARLRKKIERDPAHPQLIKTVRGIGYLWACRNGEMCD